MTTTKTMRGDWVVAGGAPGETAHCTRCGAGLRLGEQLLVVFVAASKAFTKAHLSCQPGIWKEPEPTLSTWGASRDTGISSATIFYVFTGQKLYQTFDVPHDPGDFGRCHRLLKLAPRWREQLAQICAPFPAWEPFVRDWPKLEAMYEGALKTNDGREMYEFMQGLDRRMPPMGVR